MLNPSKTIFRLSASEIRIILILSVTGIFDYYYMGLVSFALPEIQRYYHLAEKDIGPVVGLLRLGYIPAVLIAITADFIGRKPFIIISTVMLIVFSLASAMAQSIGLFVLFQFLGFMFISAETSVAVVMIVEAVKNDLRGFAVSLLGGLSAIGTGSAAIVYSINSYYHLSFKYNYYYGIVPLLIIIFLRTTLKETSYFSSQSKNDSGLSLKHKLRERYSLIASRKKKLFALVLMAMSYDGCITPAYVLASKFVQESRNFKPYEIGYLIVISGSIATITAVFIGYLSDIFGRKKILILLFLLTMVSVVFFYNSTHAALYIFWCFFIIVSSAASSLIMAIYSELFHTSTRVTANGLRGAFTAIGAALGLLLEGVLYSRFNSHSTSVSILASLVLISILSLYFFIPETAGKELNEIV